MTEPISNGDEWTDRAACQGEDTVIFFDLEEAEPAKALCLRCEVRPACLEYALALNIRDGIWGGMTGQERRRQQQRRQAA